LCKILLFFEINFTFSGEEVDFFERNESGAVPHFPEQVETNESWNSNIRAVKMIMSQILSWQ